MLTAERLREVLDYDLETGEFRWRITMGCRGVAGRVAGCLCATGYQSIRINRKPYQAHRLAWLHVYGEWPRNEIDHMNGNKADNRLSNLREATRFQNTANRKSRKTFKGVYLLPSGRWAASIQRDKLHHLGCFDTPEEAHAAYCSAAIERFGEFANDGNGPLHPTVCEDAATQHGFNMKD